MSRHKSSLRNNIIIGFVLIIVVGGTVNISLMQVLLEKALLNKGIDQAVVTSVFRQFVMMSTGINILGIIVAIAVSTFFSKRITGPILELAEKVRSFSGGDRDIRIVVDSEDEIGELAASFNQMVENLQRTTTSIDALNKEIVERKTAEAGLKTALIEIRNVQTKLLRTGKMASIGQLAAGVAHEINNPVGFIRANLDVLQISVSKLFAVIDSFEQLARVRGMGGQEGFHRVDACLEALVNNKEIAYLKGDLPLMINECLEGTVRIKNIVLSLRTLSHPKVEERYPTNVNDEVDKALVLVGGEIKYKCELVKELTDVPQVKANPSQLQQVFINVLMNASQAIEKNGIIMIRTYCKDHFVCIDVADNGKGISPEVIDQIFDPFYTSKSVGEGTGLGLSIVYGIIEKHGGTIDVKSQLGQGTTFTIRLPLE